MHTVLLWGDAWWVSDASGPLPLTHPSGAADALAAHFADRRPRLRLIYQPDSLAAVETPCPKGARSTLAAALAGSFPALADPACAWSFEPILSRNGEFSTILHFEREPGALSALITHLEQLGFAIDSVWPLGSFLTAVPDEWTDSGATTVLALHGRRACAYRHGSDGHRIIQVWTGEEVVADVAAWLQPIFARNPAEPLLLVASDADTAALDARVPVIEREGFDVLTLPEALGHDVHLPSRHPAQLIPPPGFLTIQRTVAAAGLLLVALGAGVGAMYARDVAAWRSAGADYEARKQTLRTEVSNLRANAAEIARLREALNPAASPPAAALLQKISATAPPEAACHALSVTSAGFTLTGHLAPSAPAGTGEAWRARLADPAWTLELKPSRDGGFALTGSFGR